MQVVLDKKEIVYESRQSGSTLILLAQFQGGSTILFTCSSENHLRTTLSGCLDGKIEDHQQQSVAQKYLAKVGSGYISLKIQRLTSPRHRLARKSPNSLA